MGSEVSIPYHYIILISCSFTSQILFHDGSYLDQDNKPRALFHLTTVVDTWGQVFFLDSLVVKHLEQWGPGLCTEHLPVCYENHALLG